MTAAPKPEWEERGWTAARVARYIGVSVTWFTTRKDKLFKKYGFPMPSPVTGKYDGKAVSLWYDAHSNLSAPGATVDPSSGWRQGLDALSQDHGALSH